MARYPRSQAVRIEDEPVLTRRRTRSPQYPFAVNIRPWVLQPAFCVPVLPGETLKSANLQMRVVSDPIVSNTQGWWLEFYAFYVRAGDLRGGDDTNLRNLASSQVSQWGGTADAIDWNFGHAQATLPSFIKRCTAAVVDAYFRTDLPGAGTPEAEPAGIQGALPTVGIAGSSVFQSMRYEGQFNAGPAGDQWNKNWMAFQNMREAFSLVDKGVKDPNDAGYAPGGGQANPVNDFREYLSKSGVRVAPQLTESNAAYQKPELIRFVRDFAYPTPTVNQTDGTIKSTVQWSMAERIDKRRFLAEPGFICGYVCVRPKVYYGNQNGSLVDLFNAYNWGWLPPEYDDEPHMSMVQLTMGNVVQNGGTQVAWCDVKDLYLYGEQFTNFNPSGTITGAQVPNIVALPDAMLTNKRYPALTDAQKLFVDGGAAGTAQLCHVDGMMSFRIATRIRGDVTT